jgi:hypothetical protein
VLFDGVQDCAQLFHLPLHVPNSVFDGLDYDDVPTPNGTGANPTDIAIVPAQPQCTNEVLNDLGITFVNGLPVVPNHDDEPDTPQVMDETPEEEEEVVEDGNLYARDLSTPSMDGYSFRNPAIDTVFHEMYETLWMHCRDMLHPVDTVKVQMQSLLVRTVHEGLIEQMDQLEEIIGPIDEEHTLISYGQVFVLTNGARALMDADLCTFKWIGRSMWYSVIPRNPDE